MMRHTPDFGEKSQDYRQFRPTYPEELYEYLLKTTIEHTCAWDCGTGNGQAAAVLANDFAQVIGTDISQKQLDVAVKKSNIHYYCCPAEVTPIESNTVDLITVAQALHWFDLDAFYREVTRVAKPEGVIAVWCYSLGSVNANIDPFIKKLYNDILGNHYWSSERQYIDDAYMTIPFPFPKIKAPYFAIEKEMYFSGLLGYLNTWSAVKTYQNKNQVNPIDLIYDDLKAAWGDDKAKYTMHWPIHLLIGKIK